MHSCTYQMCWAFLEPELYSWFACGRDLVAMYIFVFFLGCRRVRTHHRLTVDVSKSTAPLVTESLIQTTVPPPAVNLSADIVHRSMTVSYCMNNNTSASSSLYFVACACVWVALLVMPWMLHSFCHSCVRNFTLCAFFSGSCQADVSQLQARTYISICIRVTQLITVPSFSFVLRAAACFLFAEPGECNATGSGSDCRWWVHLCVSVCCGHQRNS